MLTIYKKQSLCKIIASTVYIFINLHLDSLDTTSTITTATNAAFAAPAMDKHLEAQGCEKISESVINKENDSKSANRIVTDVENPFDNAFKMPSDYLPKRKRIKVESSGKPRLLSAGTSDQWMQYHSKKENYHKIKEEKQQKRKQFLEEKNY